MSNEELDSALRKAIIREKLITPPEVIRLPLKNISSHKHSAAWLIRALKGAPRGQAPSGLALPREKIRL